MRQPLLDQDPADVATADKQSATETAIVASVRSLVIHLTPGTTNALKIRTACCD